MGSTIIYTSHYMEEVEAICTRISIMDHGKVIAEGTKGELTSMVTDVNTVYIEIGSIDGIKEEELKGIKGVKAVEIRDSAIKITSLKDVGNFNDIIHYFISKNIPIRNLRNEIPDLETVFLTLTGRKLRD